MGFEKYWPEALIESLDTIEMKEADDEGDKIDMKQEDSTRDTLKCMEHSCRSTCNGINIVSQV